MSVGRSWGQVERFAEISSKYSLSVFFCCYCSVTKDLKGCLGCEQGTLHGWQRHFGREIKRSRLCEGNQKTAAQKLEAVFFFQITSNNMDWEYHVRWPPKKANRCRLKKPRVSDMFRFTLIWQGLEISVFTACYFYPEKKTDAADFRPNTQTCSGEDYITVGQTDRGVTSSSRRLFPPEGFREQKSAGRRQFFCNKALKNCNRQIWNKKNKTSRITKQKNELYLIFF